YCGALECGNPTGILSGGSHGERQGLFQGDVPSFGVSGDMRNLFVGGPIGTSTPAGGAGFAAVPYLSGFFGRIRGTVNQIKAENGAAGSISAKFEIDHNPSARHLFLRQREIETHITRS